jgi:hypothetical protein
MITMFDPASISAALGSVKVIFELLKNAKDAQLARKVSEELANVHERLIDVQQQVLDLQNENQGLRDQIRQMKRAIEDENSFQFMHGVYWKTRDVLTSDVDEEGNRIKALYWDGPFCPLCKDVNGKAVRLKNIGHMQKSPNSLWQCEVHNTEYEAPTMSD